MEKEIKEKAKAIEEKAEYGIKETSELIDGVMSLTVFLIPEFKKGGVPGAIKNLYHKMKTDVQFESEILNAIDKIEMVPKEAKDIGMMEATRLTMKLLGYVPSIVAALKED